MSARTRRGGRGPGFAAIAALIALSTTGCVAAGSPVGRVPGAEPPTGELAATPPDAWLAGQQPHEPFVLFHLDRPAYVAIFEIRGDAARTVYPSSPGFEQRRLRSGVHVVEAGLPASRAFDAVAGFDGFRQATLGLGCLSSPVVYRLLVASHQPLRLEELAGDVAFRYLPALSHRFAGTSTFGTMEYLIDRAVPGAGAGNQGWSAYYDAFWVCGVDARPIRRRLPVLGLLRVASADRRDDPPRRAPEGERETGREALLVASPPDAPRRPKDAPALLAPIGPTDGEAASGAAGERDPIRERDRVRSYPVTVNLPGSVRISPLRGGGVEVERRGFPAPRVGDDRGWSVPRPLGQTRGARPSDRNRSRSLIGGSWNPSDPPRARVRPTRARPKLGKPLKKDGGTDSDP